MNDTNENAKYLIGYNDEDLINELENRGYYVYNNEMAEFYDVDYNTSSIDDYDNWDLLNALEDRGLKIFESIGYGDISLYDSLRVQSVNILLKYMTLDELEQISNRVEKARRYR